MISKIDVTYLAGLFDARGSIFCQKVKQKRGKNYNYLPLVALSSVDSTRLLPFAEAIGVDTDNKIQFGKNNTIEFLTMIEPYLKWRKKMVRELLALEKIRVEFRKKNGRKKSFDDETLNKMETHYQNFIKYRDYRDDRLEETS